MLPSPAPPRRPRRAGRLIVAAVTLIASTLIASTLIASALIASTAAAAAPLRWQGNGPCRLLIFGDSLAARWTAPPPAGWQQAIVGTSGARASDLVRDAGPAIAAARPNAVLIFAGSNDARAAALWAWWPWGNAANAAAAAISAMASAGQANKARVIIADLLPPGPQQPWWRALLIGDRQGRAMAAIMARLALPAGTRRLPVAQLLAGPAGTALRGDYLHYSAAGYARLAAGLVPLLQDACPAQVG